jgi:hypothetical protein
MILSEHVGRMEEQGGTYRVLVREPQVKQQLGRPERKREDNIKVNLREIERGVD